MMESCVESYYIVGEEIRSNSDFVAPERGVNVYEVIRVIDGVPLFLEEHLERLSKSLDLAGQKSKYSGGQIDSLIKELITKNNNAIGNIKIILNFYEESEQLYIFYIPHSYPGEELYGEGVDTILFKAERENPNAKIINSSLRDRVNDKLKETGCYEAILVDSLGRITEGSRSNIFFVRDNVLITSPVEAVLSGITRERIIKLAKANSLEVREAYISEEELKSCEAAFISGTSPKILPIKSIGAIKFSSSCNLMVKKLMTLYDNNIDNYIKGYSLK